MEKSVELDAFLSTKVQLEVRNHMTKLDNNATNLCGPLLPCMFFIVAYALTHGVGTSPLL
jgi:hypothetical protein